jgi:predicted nucleotidyltransferase
VDAEKGTTSHPAAARAVALDNDILRGVVGSTSHGTAIEGQDDRDEMAVFVEPPEYVCGLTPCDHYIYRDQPEGARSQPGDLDLTMYSLRKYCRLAAQGNPSVILLLWLPTYISRTPIGAELVRMREAFVSQTCGRRFLGYLVAQKMRLQGDRARTVSRPELVEKYGYDTKFAMHALRLGYEGIELMTHRRLTLPVAEPNLTTLRAVRGGQIDLTEALRLIDDAEARLTALVKACPWQAEFDGINRFMVQAHAEHWRLRGMAVSGLVPTVQRL